MESTYRVVRMTYGHCVSSVTGRTLSGRSGLFVVSHSLGLRRFSAWSQHNP